MIPLQTLIFNSKINNSFNSNKKKNFHPNKESYSINKIELNEKDPHFKESLYNERNSIYDSNGFNSVDKNFGSTIENYLPFYERTMKGQGKK